MGKLSTQDAVDRLRQLPGWELENGAISRKFTFAGFADAVAFVVRLGFAAEAADHHPDILISYKRVTMTYVTHSEGGLTEKDFAGASQATAIAESFGATGTA
jgi:4a-hydroxytetrahydrobiopterin dehydratase